MPRNPELHRRFARRCTCSGSAEGALLQVEVPPQSGVANSVTTLAHRTTRYCQSRDPELALRPNRKIHFSVIAGLDPQLSGSAFCFSYTKAPKTPAQRWRSLAGLVPAIHVFERGSANGREGVVATDQVSGLKAHGLSPAKGISGCIDRATNNRLRSTGQAWARPGHPRAVSSGRPGLRGCPAQGRA